MAWFRPVNWGLRKFEEGGSPHWRGGANSERINQNLHFSVSEDVEMLNEGLQGGAHEQGHRQGAELCSREPDWKAGEALKDFWVSLLTESDRS